MNAPTPIMPARRSRVTSRRRGADTAALVQARAVLMSLRAVLMARDSALCLPDVCEVDGLTLWADGVAVALVRGSDVVVRAVRDPVDPMRDVLAAVEYAVTLDPERIATVALEIEVRIRVRRGQEVRHG